jgi:flagellar FliJ protein
MTRFPFRLERLLDLRSRKEREQAEALGCAVRDEAARRAALAQAQAQLGAAQAQAAQAPGGVSLAGVLRNFGLTVTAAETQRDSAAERTAEAGQQVDAERDRYTSAQRDRRVIERLREKRFEDWTREEGRKEQQDMDGLALDRHRRKQEDPR